METIRSYICSLIGKQSIESVNEDTIGIRDLKEAASKLVKNIPRKTQFTSISKFLYDLFGCKDFFPEPPSYCIDEGDCDPGFACKQGECVTDPTHCINSGCQEEEGYQCNEETGECEFLPECNVNNDCNMIEGGETCIKNVCKVPPICIPGTGLGVEICAPTWQCVNGACTKADCSTVTYDNKISCCSTDIAFSLNQESCCLYDPFDPRCPP